MTTIKARHPDLRMRLKVPKYEAYSRIKSRIKKGIELKKSIINTVADYQRAEEEKELWHSFNYEMLLGLFDSDVLAREYLGSGFPDSYIKPKLSNIHNLFNTSMERKIKALERILDMLDFIAEIKGTGASSPDQSHRSPTQDVVFAIYGGDQTAKQAVTAFIEKLGLRTRIVDSKPHYSTYTNDLIDRNLKYAFAIMVLTPADIGYPQSNPQQPRIRASQSDILKLGCFLGELGKGKVCALFQEDMELPTGNDGIAFIELDNKEGWQLKLAKQIANAGIDIDINRAL